jgi:hypothetical protein
MAKALSRSSLPGYNREHVSREVCVDGMGFVRGGFLQRPAIESADFAVS